MGYLLYVSSVDKVVNEQVAVAAPEPASGRSVDTKRYQTAVIWCRAFSVAFGGARLA
jgi:hypothetical protein